MNQITNMMKKPPLLVFYPFLWEKKFKICHKLFERKRKGRKMKWEIKVVMKKGSNLKEEGT